MKNRIEFVKNWLKCLEVENMLSMSANNSAIIK